MKKLRLNIQFLIGALIAFSSWAKTENTERYCFRRKQVGLLVCCNPCTWRLALKERREGWTERRLTSGSPPLVSQNVCQVGKAVPPEVSSLLTLSLLSPVNTISSGHPFFLPFWSHRPCHEIRPKPAFNKWPDTVRAMTVLGSVVTRPW